MSDNGGRSKGSIIRIILCIIILITILLAMLDIIPKKLAIPMSAVCLTAVSLWNGISYFKNGKKKQAVFIFAASASLILMLILYFMTL